MSRTHVAGLDGLRGVAVLAVVAYHLGHLRGGFVGVDLFFVLSGFLITTLLLSDPPEGRAGLWNWWNRRFTRLTPAVAVVVIAVLALFSTMAGIGWDAIATLTWWQNWHLIIEQTAYWATDPSPLRHAWSLSIEEQFYLVWPLLLIAMVAIARRTRREPESIVAPVAVGLALSSFLWAAYLSSSSADLSRIYFGTDTRAGALLIGCAAAAVMRRSRSGRQLGEDDARPAPVALTVAALLAALALAGLTLTLSADMVVAYRGGLALAAVSSLVLVVTVTRPGPVATAMSVEPLRWIGVRSYGIYLWSWPVQLAIEERLRSLPQVAVSLLVVGLSILLADLSLRFVETPMRRGVSWARRLQPRRAAWLGGLALIVVGLAVAHVNTAPTPAAQQVSSEDAADLALQPPTTPPTTAPPVDGAPGTPTTVAAPGLRLMVVGDSLAFATAFLSGPKELNPAGIASADGRGFIGCGVLSRAGWNPITTAGEVVGWEPDCPKQPEAERLGLTASPDWVVSFVGGWEGGAFEDPDGEEHEAQSDEIRQAILDELVASGERANAAGARMAWVTWVCPGYRSDREFADDYPEWINDVMREASAQVPGSIVIEPTDRVCVDADANGEPTEEKDVAWNFEHHPEDTAWLWQVWLGPALRAAS